MTIQENQNFVIFPGGARGDYEGELSGVVQGDTTLQYNIYARLPDAANFALALPLSGYYWPHDQEGAAPTDITGTLDINGSDSTLLEWSPSAADVGTAGRFYIIFVSNGRKSMPVEWTIYNDPSVS